ncbi:MAG TPA: long-chain fatty acid--CoA ligase [Thermoplasmata archaeon]|nr:long-chain fatty acid--CoA ligase [Thermoplasmata archaeon]
MLPKPWHKHWPEGVPKTIEYPDIAVHELLRRTARAHPDWPAVRFYGKALSYRQLDDDADRFAAGLRILGVKPGDRVSLLLPNTPHFFVALFGILRAGAIVVQTNPLYTPRELEALYNDAGVETVVAMDLFWPNLIRAKPNTPVKRVIVCDVAEFLPTPLRQLYPIRKRGDLKKQGHWPLRIPAEPWVHRFRELLATPGQPGTEPPVNPREDVAVLQYTGGTTGTPKGAMLTHRNLVANALQTSSWLPTRGPTQERFLGVIPLFHVYGLTTALTGPVTLGAEVILHPNPREIKAILKLINKTRPTIFPGVPTLYIALLRFPKLSNYDLHSIRACISGSAPLPNEVRHEFERVTGGKLVEGFGLTEASPVTHSNPLEGLIKECIGIPFPDTDSKIVDMEDASKDLPQGEVGELAIHGPQVMKGYWHKPEETANVLHDGWLLTGDIGKMDTDGYFYIVDRKKDMILCSGYNVYPREVEEVLYMHPAVQEAAAIGVPDPYRGESVKAFVVLKPGTAATAEEIIAFCKGKLAPFKVPKQVAFEKELPKTMVGKVLRRELKEREAAKAGAKAA